MAVTSMLAASAVVSAGAAIHSGEQQRRVANSSADQAEADAEAAAGQAQVEAKKIREATKSQRGAAVAALAASGVDVGEGTAEQIQVDIDRRGEEDALTAILSGNYGGRMLKRDAQGLRIGGANAAAAGHRRSFLRARQRKRLFPLEVAHGAQVVSRDGAVTVIEGADVAHRYPRALGRQPIATVNQVTEEIARVYRAITQGKIPVKDGTSLVYVLRELSRNIEVGKIEPVLDDRTRTWPTGRVTWRTGSPHACAG